MSKLAITPRMLVDYVRGPRFFEARYILKSIDPHTVTPEESFEQSVRDLLFTGECNSVSCPIEYLDSRGNMTTAAAKDWKQKMLADGLTVLSHADWQTLRFAVDAARERMVKCFGEDKLRQDRDVEVAGDEYATSVLPRLGYTGDRPMLLFVVTRMFDLVYFLESLSKSNDELETTLVLSEAFYTLVIASALPEGRTPGLLMLESKPPFQCLGVQLSSDCIQMLSDREAIVAELSHSIKSGCWVGHYEEEPFQL